MPAIVSLAGVLAASEHPVPAKVMVMIWLEVEPVAVQLALKRLVRVGPGSLPGPGAERSWRLLVRLTGDVAGTPNPESNVTVMVSLACSVPTPLGANWTCQVAPVAPAVAGGGEPVIEAPVTMPSVIEMSAGGEAVAVSVLVLTLNPVFAYPPATGLVTPASLTDVSVLSGSEQPVPNVMVTAWPDFCPVMGDEQPAKPEP